MQPIPQSLNQSANWSKLADLEKRFPFLGLLGQYTVNEENQTRSYYSLFNEFVHIITMPQ